MNENINKLLKIEMEIAHLYNLLLNLEIDEKKELTSYIVTLNALKNTTIDEEKQINSLTIEELNILKDNNKLEELLKKKQINLNITINDIIERISRQVVDILISQILINDNKKKLSDILLSESKDIFLSYLDEIIETSQNKKELLLYKYKYIFTMPSINEKRLIERNFNTDKSLYLSSLMYSQILKIDTNTYETYKNLLSTDILAEVLNMLKENTHIFLESPTREIAYAKLRTSLNMMSSDLFEEIGKKFQKENQFLTLFFLNEFDDSFIETIKKDRERHKVLSLKKLKNGI